MRRSSWLLAWLTVLVLVFVLISGLTEVVNGRVVDAQGEGGDDDDVLEVDLSGKYREALYSGQPIRVNRDVEAGSGDDKEGDLTQADDLSEEETRIFNGQHYKKERLARQRGAQRQAEAMQRQRHTQKKAPQRLHSGGSSGKEGSKKKPFGPNNPRLPRISPKMKRAAERAKKLAATMPPELARIMPDNPADWEQLIHDVAKARDEGERGDNGKLTTPSQRIVAAARDNDTEALLQYLDDDPLLVNAQVPKVCVGVEVVVLHSGTGLVDSLTCTALCDMWRLFRR